MEPAYDDAVKLLARRGYARRAIEERLAAKGHGEDAITRAVARLAADGAIDDDAYARRFIATRGAGRGRERVLRELALRGIDDDVAASAWRASEDDGARDEADSLRRAIRRRLGDPPGTADGGRLARVYNALLSEGFEPAFVASALVPYGFRGDEG